jgi:hypothetical protein
VFAIEALGLVDHFNFLDKSATGAKRARSPKPSKPSKPPKPSANLRQVAVDAGWFLSTSDKWTEPYFDAGDLHFADRTLFC